MPATERVWGRKSVTSCSSAARVTCGSPAAGGVRGELPLAAEPLREHRQPRVRRCPPIGLRGAPCREHLVAVRPSRHRRSKARVGRSGDPRREAIHRAQERRVRFCAHHDGRRLFAHLGGQPREELGDEPSGEPCEGRDGHPLDAEGGQHATDVVNERLVGDDDEHLVGPEPLRLAEREIGDAMQPDGRLSAPGAPLNRHEPDAVLRDQIELSSSSMAAMAGKCLSWRSCPSAPDAEARRLRRPRTGPLSSRSRGGRGSRSRDAIAHPWRERTSLAETTRAGPRRRRCSHPGG